MGAVQPRFQVCEDEMDDWQIASQCLDRRIADKQILAHEVNAWQDHRNKHRAKANWQFKTADARVKLKRLYPQFG
jgi:hypothetical protein